MPISSRDGLYCKSKADKTQSKIERMKRSWKPQNKAIVPILKVLEPVSFKELGFI